MQFFTKSATLIGILWTKQIFSADYDCFCLDVIIYSFFADSVRGKPEEYKTVLWVFFVYEILGMEIGWK